jgi:light-regulated signal transduction histidine kinase (bacteriophytochrome)
VNSNNITLPCQVDLSNCDLEPIHIPGYIQPHGILLALQEPELTILQISNNTFNFWGLHPEQLLGRNLSCLLDSVQINLLKQFLAQEHISIVNPIKFHIKLGEQSLYFDGIIHRSQEILILELEPELSTAEKGNFRFYHLLKQSMLRLQCTSNLSEITQIIVEEVRKITGFDRVMVYRFNENWHGQVIAEDKQEYLTSYLGVYYPASDIPAQARKLYTQNWLRLLPDANYQPAAIVPRNNPLTQEPLDLSESVLRSLSPLHIEYMHNMGVKASMSISLIKNKKLWGLIACHHQSPKYIPYEIRHACEFLGQIISLELGSTEEIKDAEYKLQLKSCHSKLVEYMSAEKNFIDGLIKYQPNLLNLVNAEGAVVCFQGEYFTIGNTPEKEDIESLVVWVSHNLQAEIFSTDSLSQVYPEAERMRDIASGLMVLSIAQTQQNYVLWFRPEVIQTVDWGGNPHKPIEVNGNGDLHLSPRKSFKIWKERVQLKSTPWKPCEIEAALELRSAIISVVLRKADELAQINIELERSNNELDAFAYIASHDLKEPLRGIHNYSNFLIEDYGIILDNEGKAKLNTLIRLTQRMEHLIDSLLHFSRLGRVDILRKPTNLNLVVQQILDLLIPRIEELSIEIRIPQSLPTVYCDPVQVGEVFNNLITNAIKYNDKALKWIEIGYIQSPSGPITFYVKDNGIGIQQKHFQTIFRIFKQLHKANKYGGGIGAGLTIAKKIVERHGGKIWVDSTYGEGSTFYFTLGGEYDWQ